MSTGCVGELVGDHVLSDVPFWWTKEDQLMVLGCPLSHNESSQAMVWPLPSSVGALCMKPFKLVTPQLANLVGSVLARSRGNRSGCLVYVSTIPQRTMFSARSRPANLHVGLCQCTLMILRSPPLQVRMVLLQRLMFRLVSRGWGWVHKKRSPRPPCLRPYAPYLHFP